MSDMKHWEHERDDRVFAASEDEYDAIICRLILSESFNSGVTLNLTPFERSLVRRVMELGWADLQRKLLAIEDRA